MVGGWKKFYFHSIHTVAMCRSQSLIRVNGFFPSGRPTERVFGFVSAVAAVIRMNEMPKGAQTSKRKTSQVPPISTVEVPHFSVDSRISFYILFSESKAQGGETTSWWFESGNVDYLFELHVVGVQVTDTFHSICKGKIMLEAWLNSFLGIYLFCGCI